MVPSSSPGPGPRPLSTESADRLREAVRLGAVSPVADDAPVRDAIALVVTEARARGMHPEELIPAFKALLDSLPELQLAASRYEEPSLRERLVTLCIKAYYGVSGGD
ncbi:MAG: hypothetical protein ACJ79S_15760 [Gemmatimonadaceae bacterium]